MFARLFGSSRSDPGRRVPDPAAAQRRRHPQPAPARPAGAAAGDDSRRHAVGAGPRAADGASRSSPARSPVPEEGSVLPEQLFLPARRDARGGAGADAGGDAPRAGAALGAAAAGERGGDAARGDHPRLDRREGDRQGRRAAAGGRRLFQPAAARHAAPGRSHRHLPGDAGAAARPAHPASRSCTPTTATTPMPAPACRSGRSPIPGARRSPPCSIRRRPRRSISSPTAPAATSSPTRSPSTRPTSRAGTRSAAPAARCDA